MEAVKLLGLYYPEAAVEVLKQSLNDSYELVRRLSAIYAERIGAPQLVPSIVKTFLQRGHEPRLGFQLMGNIEAFDSQALQHELDRHDRKSTRLNSSHANISYAVFCLKKT